MFGCNSVNPVYGSRIDRAQIKVRMMCFSRVRWACLAHIGSMLVNSVQPAVGSEVAEAGAGPRFPVLCLPTIAEHPGGRERERVVALLCTGFTGLLIRAKGSSDPSFELLGTAADESVCSSASYFCGNIYRRLYIARCRSSWGPTIELFLQHICYIFNNG